MLRRDDQAGRLLSRLAVVLADTRFPENIGMTARACANMGVGVGSAPLRLVRPRHWDIEKALPLATPQGAPLLESATVWPDPAQAVADAEVVVGTTARIGGWRQGLLPPKQGAAVIVAALSRGARAALLLGPEDRGLSNADILLCTHLVHIPTHPGDTSLNLAQAALLMLYECREAALAQPASHSAAPSHTSTIAHAERERLYAALQEALIAIDALPAQNPAYFMLPLRRLFNRAPMRREECDLLMGVCRQIRWLAAQKEQK